MPIVVGVFRVILNVALRSEESIYFRTMSKE